MDMELLTVEQAEQLAMGHSYMDRSSRSSTRSPPEFHTVLDSASPIRPSISCRMDAWVKRKDDRTKVLRETLNNVKLQECSFRPNVRRPSTPKSVDIDVLVNRLSIPKKVVPKPQAELHQECTFTPDTGKSRQSFSRQHVFQSYDSFYSQKSVPDPVQYSYRPSTNAVRDNMLYCRAYLQENVFSRLARPLEPENTPKSEQSSHAFSSVPVVWNDFLERQNSFHRERSEWLTEKTQREDDAMFKPQLCTRSRAIAARMKNTPAEQSTITRRASAPTFSFQPEIRKRSRLLPRRSNYSLSVGDQMKKEETIRKLREQLENEKASHVAREAQTLRDNAVKTSVPAEDSASLRERVAQRKRERQQAVLEEKQKREAELTRECSFQPTIKAAPSFVRRVAESYRLARQIKGDSQGNDEKVGWR